MDQNVIELLLLVAGLAAIWLYARKSPAVEPAPPPPLGESKLLRIIGWASAALAAGVAVAFVMLPSSSVATIDIDYLCPESEETARLIYKMASQQNVSLLPPTAGVFAVKEGDRVKAWDFGQFSRVEIQSGDNAGQSCWMPRILLVPY